MCEQRTKNTIFWNGHVGVGYFTVATFGVVTVMHIKGNSILAPRQGSCWGKESVGNLGRASKFKSWFLTKARHAEW